MTTRPPIPAHPRLGIRLAYRVQRAAGQGRAADLRLLHLPIDHRRWGQNSWLNYWQGRDEGLWTGEAGDTGDNVPHQQPALGGS